MIPSQVTRTQVLSRVNGGAIARKRLGRQAGYGVSIGAVSGANGGNGGGGGGGGAHGACCGCGLSLVVVVIVVVCR